MIEKKIKTREEWDKQWKRIHRFEVKAIKRFNENWEK
jgi:hypothetical protein